MQTDLQPFIQMINAAGYSVFEQYEGSWFVRFGASKDGNERWFYILKTNLQEMLNTLNSYLKRPCKK